MTKVDLKRINELLSQHSADERQAMLQVLRQEFPIHDLEGKLNVSAEVILEAIDRSSDLTLRGIRGVIAEAAFKEYVVTPMVERGWTEFPIDENAAFDFLLATPSGLKFTIQVKMQRMKAKQPMRAIDANKRLFSSAEQMWVVETQKTRGGKGRDGRSTRPYRFGEFDIIAVSLHPSTNNWRTFCYTVANWLLPDLPDSKQMFKFQPIPKSPNDDWTDRLETCVEWLEAAAVKTIRAGD
jgi:hypothetical protein